ncbi:uncharacterized protein A4U43_C03F5940 [Asparagus officinalis]|uniref:Uncharacterized protein n=1 Tax=Asparagus officinalis TaxID=4686 RepID=A0A5P1FCT2_ASPOF|nr:uncharacterized protein A4U43_C03F5940 [Asparagus officinalis]
MSSASTVSTPLLFSYLCRSTSLILDDTTLSPKRSFRRHHNQIPLKSASSSTASSLSFDARLSKLRSTSSFQPLRFSVLHIFSRSPLARSNLTRRLFQSQAFDDAGLEAGRGRLRNNSCPSETSSPECGSSVSINHSAEGANSNGFEASSSQSAQPIRKSSAKLFGIELRQLQQSPSTASDVQGSFRFLLSNTVSPETRAVQNKLQFLCRDSSFWNGEVWEAVVQ